MRHDLRTLHESLLGGKLPRNLSWTDTLELVGHLGQVEPHGTNEFLFVVGAERAFFKKPHTADLGVEEVAKLRSFLRRAGGEPATEEPGQPIRMVVVIDHHTAHVYQDFGQHAPEIGDTIRPYDPFGFHHHLVHRKEAHYKGERVPEENSYYQEIAGKLTGANEIVLIGHGTGKSSAAVVLAEYLKSHRPEVFSHVLATETADLSALTDPQLETLAREHMISVV